MDPETEVIAANGDAPESDQAKEDGLLSQDQEELSERVAHLEKRVREQEDEIICLKSALADVMRRLGQVETTKSQNSILPSRPFKSSAARKERPKSQLIESSNFTPRSSAPSSARQTPRGASANTMKKWGSTEDTHGSQKRERPHSASSKLDQSNIKEPTWNAEDKYVRMHLKGRPITIYAPSNLDDFDVKAAQNPPHETLSLEWVYGYRGRDCRSNLYTIATGEVVYFAAAAVILHNLSVQSQRHYLEHTDDIKCLAVHPEGEIIATGQVAGHDKEEGEGASTVIKGRSLAIHPDQVRVATGQVAGHEKKEGKPHVRVWDSIKLTTLHVIGIGEFERGVCCVSFSKVDGGNMLLAVDESNEHAVSVWDIKKEKPQKITKCKTSGDPVTQCEFHPTEESSIVCCGKSQIYFLTFLHEEKTLDKKSGIFQKYEKPRVIICFCFTENGDVVSGDSSGNIYVWEKGCNKISKAITDAHDGGVFSLFATKDGNILSGGKDRKICQWDSNYQKVGDGAEIPAEFGGVRMISQGPGNMLLVGTIRNCILQGNMELSFAPVVEGHMDELWGLDTLPSKHQFLTCGSDKHIYMWDAQRHTCVWRQEIAESAHCCSVHPELDVAAIGLETGKINIIDLETHEIVAVYTDGKEQIECLQYSPDGRKLAAGCRDNYIYMYDVSDDGKTCKKVGRCSGHSSFVTHIDWSEDGQVLRSNSGDHELLYWTTKTCKQETQKDDVRNLVWATQNCTLAFDSIGVWPDNADGTDVNMCSSSHNKKLLVSADDFGKVNLYENPCIQPRATGHIYSGHSSHVTSTKFLFDDSRVISTGGRDMSVMQWQVHA